MTLTPRPLSCNFGGVSPCAEVEVLNIGTTPIATARACVVNCMAEQGITVENVEVGVADGRHVETFSWEPADGEVAEDVAQECEDSALQQFEVSRT